MPLFTKAILGGLIAIPILGSAIIGAAYSSPFLMHIDDIVNGTTTQTVASLNAPNWGFAVPLPQVVGTAGATTSGGTVASSTAYTFGVAALDPVGTTSIGSLVTVKTDPAGSPSERIQLSWSPVAGATGYAVFFATGTVSTAARLNQYFLATTSSAYTFSTSSASLAGSYANTDTTAFSDVIRPGGVSYINGDNGTATGSPAAASGTALEINGGLRVTEVGTTTSCDAQTQGVIFYNTSNGHEWGCNGTAWTKIF